MERQTFDADVIEIGLPLVRNLSRRRSASHAEKKASSNKGLESGGQISGPVGLEKMISMS
jgi:hypothetical protein